MNHENNNVNNIMIFENEEFGNVRLLMIDNEPWFVGKDVANALKYVNTKDALNIHVDDEDKRVIQRSEITTLEIPNRGMTIINESGLYSLILSSKLPSAKRFKRWVTHDVIPYIRKTGGYALPNGEPFSTEIQFMENMVSYMKRKELEDKERDSKIVSLNEDMDKVIGITESIKDAVTPVIDNWRPEIKKKINQISLYSTFALKSLYRTLYQELNARAGCDIYRRLSNKKNRMRLEGATHSSIMDTNCLDVIDSDKRLRQIFEKIVMEYFIKYCS